MQQHEVSYLAGIIDGEGTITILKRGNSFHPVVSIANTSLELLRWCKARVGLPSVICTKKPQFANHSLSYHIQWRFDAALQVTKMCLPYLIVKKSHAQTLLQWKSVVRRNGRYSSEELGSRNDIIHKIRAQNSRPGWKRPVENSL